MESEAELHGENAGEDGRYLVAVSGSGNSGYLIRWTAATCRRLNIPWTALHVRGSTPEPDPSALERNLELARKLGGEVLSVPDDEIAATLIRYAHVKKAGTLVLGKTGDGSSSFLGKRSVMDTILREARDLDLIVLRGRNPVSLRRSALRRADLPSALRGIPVALAAVSGTTAFGLWALPVIGYRSVAILYLLAIISLPFFCGRLAVFLSAAAGVLLWNYLFIPPRRTFTIGSLEDVIMFAAFFLVAFIAGYLTTRLKEKEEALSLRAGRTALLYGFTRALSRIRGVDAIASLGADYLSEHLGAEVRVFIRDASGALDLDHPYGGSGMDAQMPQPDAAVALRSFGSNAAVEQPPGRMHLPLCAPEAVLGLLIVESKDGAAFRGENRELLGAFAGNLALVLERELLAAANEDHKMAKESERLTRVLLNHVSHELRTPLTTIKGAVSGLLEGSTSDDPVLRNALLSETLTASDTLNALVEDLLSMSRLETGSLRPRIERTYAAELLGAAQGPLARELQDRRVEVHPSCRDAELDADPALMVQVFRNILRNFCAYTQGDAVLRIQAESEDDRTLVSFMDDGPGLPERELGSLFDTFYRGSNSQKRQGCGLGLSICRGIVEAHGGSIRAVPSEDSGLGILIELPKGGCP